MGTDKKQKNKDKWDYDKSSSYGRENSDSIENEETGYQRNKPITAVKKGEGLEEYNDDDEAERRERKEWNPDDFDKEELTEDEDDEK